MKKFNLTGGDFAVIFLALLIGIVPIIFLNRSENSDAVVIRIDGEEKARISLRGDKDGKYFFQSGFGLNVIEVDDGSVRVVEASCPDKLDIKQGAISKVGEKLICLPNHFVAEIVSGKKTDIDGVSR